MKLLMASIIAFGLSACVSIDGFGGQITQAQAEVLKTRAAMEAGRLHYQANIAREMARIADRSLDPVVQAWALSSIERIAGPQSVVQQTASMPSQQDGPITSALKGLAPYILPVAQLWVQREQGKDQIKFQTRQLATSVEMESLRLGLIDSMAERIARDPLVVNPVIIETPPAQIVDPVIVEPVVIYPSEG